MRKDQDMIVEMQNKGELDAQVADGTTPLVVDFHAEWCGYCKRTRPHLERISEEKPGVRFVAFDVDEDMDVYKDHSFKTIPAILLFKDGVEISRHESGDYEKLTAWLAQHGL